jgi:transcription elongation factor GreB
MSKAFTKETESDDDELALPPLPAGGKNYITPAGYARLRDELLGLIDVERPRIVEAVYWAASNGDRSENGDYIYGKKRLREVDRRIRFLTQRLEIAEVTDPSAHYGKDQVFFGSTVTYEDEAGVERCINILGIDEADTLAGQVSWLSPVARALLKSRVGEEVNLVMPDGVRVLNVISVDYPKPAST